MSSNNIVVKIALQNTFRRFNVPTNSFVAFRQAILSTLDLADADRIQLAYLDEDGDRILVDSDSELREAVLQQTNSVLRVEVQILSPLDATVKKATTSNVQQNNKGPKKAELKSIQKQAMKAEKQSFKAAKQAVKQEKLQQRRAMQAMKQELKQQRQALFARKKAARAALDEAKASVVELRDSIKACGNDNVARRQELRAQMPAARALVQERGVALRLLNQQIKALNGVAKNEQADNDAGAAPAVSMAVDVAADPIAFAVDRFASNGLTVKLITQQEMQAAKQEKGGFAALKRALVGAGIVPLNPAFTRRCEAARSTSALEQLVDTKSRALLAKRAESEAIAAKRDELARVRAVLAALRRAAKRSVQLGTFQNDAFGTVQNGDTAAATAVSNTPMAVC